MPNNIPYIGADRGADVLRMALENRTFDPVALAELRRRRQRELQERLANDEAATVIPMSGFDPENPGARRLSNTSAVSSTVRDRSLLGDVSRDINDDPYTGVDEQDRVTRVEHALDDAAITNRPEVGDASRTSAQRNAFAAFLNAEAPYKAQTSDAGRAALDAASHRKIEENQATWMSKDSAKGLSAEGTKSMEALTQSVNLGTRLKALLEKKMSENPGALTPETARERGVIGQLPDIATAKVKRWLYSHGAVQPPEGYDEATQLADWMKVLATRGLMGGVRNMEWINQIQDHLASGRLPDAANMQRLNVFLDTAPGLARDIVAVEKGHDYSLGTGARPGAPPAGAQPSPTAGAYDRYLSRRQ